MIDNFDTDKWTVLCPGEPHLLQREDGLLCIRDSRTNQKVFFGKPTFTEFTKVMDDNTETPPYVLVKASSLGGLVAEMNRWADKGYYAVGQIMHDGYNVCWLMCRK